MGRRRRRTRLNAESRPLARSSAPCLALPDAIGALTNLPAAVVLVDDAHHIVLANERAGRILGASPEALRGRSVHSALGWVPPSANDNAQGDRYEWDVELVNGDERTLGCTASVFHTSDGRNFHAIVFQDISRVKELQAERDRLLRLATLGEALPSLLHELKNPLAAVTAAAEVLIEEVSDAYVQEQIHAILSEVRRMKLGFDGIGALDRPLLSDRDHAVDYACREACRVLEARAKRGNIALRHRIASMPLLPFDPGVMRALVFNFVTNALHATEAGGVITVHCRFDRATRVMELSTVDTGSGMPPDVLARATELFYSTKPSGSGIGLALCRRAVEGAGGTLELQSVPGVGTSVVVRIPLPDPSTRSTRLPNQRR